MNNIGSIIEYWWREIPNHFKNVRIDEYVVMPNHVHGILINKNVGADPCIRPINKYLSLSEIIMKG